MGVRVLTDGKQAVMYCSVAGWAFGPVFWEGDDGESAEDRLLRFLRQLPKDARRYSDAEMEGEYAKFLTQDATNRTK